MISETLYYWCGKSQIYHILLATADWIMSLKDDVILFGDVSKQDAIDTMNAVRKYVSNGSKDAFENSLKVIKNS